VADETASTTNSEQTGTETATTEGAATEQTSETVTEGSTETDLGTTVLGNDGEETSEGSTDGEGDTDAPKAAVPETYELTPPEGFELNDDSVAAATPVFKELGLSNEQANKLMPVAADFAKRIVEQRDQQFLGTILEQRKTWLSEAKADKEIGGTNWDATMQASARALDQLGFPKGSPLRSALDESGFGNHPELIRFMAKVGKAIGEDTDFVRGDANAAVTKKTDAELFYPSKKD
jgi:hypothetical protein